MIKRNIISILLLSFLLTVYVNAANDGADLVKPEKLDDKLWKALLGQHEKFSQDCVPAFFYGKVIDQDDKAVVGVDVLAVWDKYKCEEIQSIVHTIANDKGKFKGDGDYVFFEDKAETIKTDVNGCFKVEMGQSHGLVLNVKDKRYLPPLNNRAFSFAKHRYRYKLNESTADNPTVFKVWKLSGEKHCLIRNEFDFNNSKIEKLYIDLFNKTIESEKPDQYDFSIKYDVNSKNYLFEFPNGGIVEMSSDSEFPFRAPENGYQAKYTLTPDSKLIRRYFYAKSRDGQYYSSLYINLQPGRGAQRPSLQIMSVLNPDASRNLEDRLSKSYNVTGYMEKVTSLYELQHDFPDKKKPADIGLKEWESLLYRESIIIANANQIEFHGKVLDTNGVAVSGEKIRISYKSFNENYRETLGKMRKELKRPLNESELNDAISPKKKLEVVTDANGCFVVSGIEGEEMAIMPDDAKYFVNGKEYLVFKKDVLVQGSSAKHPVKLVLSENE
ncbi:MAG: hypothetical protein JEZ07_11560 [Phycisphaerae bacterium]|nr:hypothetical protein [Phycisphaerae bacterium]